uniref:Glycosyltransferase n=1 Tax=viral metagenome TaxID=1070528 RepID=A0A6M3JCK9_9ZZZZ
MHIVHWSNWGPRVSGMYESVKNQIKYERREGHTSDITISHCEDPLPSQMDDWLIPICWEAAKKADVWVLHSNIPGKLVEDRKKKVSIAVLHGPTEHVMLQEWQKENSFNLHVDLLWKMDATVCLNQHEYDIMKLYDEKVGRCRYIPNSIDLEELKIEAMWEYDHHPAIISCDTPRIEKLPFHIIWAMPYIVEKIPDARLNIYSLLLEPIAQWRNVFCRSHERKLESLCETIQLANRNLKPFQAGADIGFNNNYSGIASRVTMEMMSYGVPVVSYGGEYTKYHAKIFDLHSIAEQVERCWKDLTAPGSTLKADTLKYAQENFHRERWVKGYVALYTELLNKK